MISINLPIGLACSYGFGTIIGSETERVRGRLH